MIGPSDLGKRCTVETREGALEGWISGFSYDEPPRLDVTLNGNGRTLVNVEGAAVRVERCGGD